MQRKKPAKMVAFKKRNDREPEQSETAERAGLLKARSERGGSPSPLVLN